MDYTVFTERRKKLVESIKKAHPGKNGVVLLFANFEHEKYRFRQESSFYYYSGITEPGIMLMIDLDGGTSAFLPSFGQSRTKWVSSQLYGAQPHELKKYGIDALHSMGAQCKGYSFSCIFSPAEYENVIATLKKLISAKKTIFTIYPTSNYIEQRMVLERLQSFVPELKEAVVDIAPLVARMRRVKTREEIEIIYKAVDCTMAAHEAVARMIEEGKNENQIQAGIEFIFTESGGSAAFPSIVASGARATTLHYNDNKGVLKKGELCVIDIGAEIEYYCGDLTRTYPVSGTFNKHQKELYTIVLETQDYIASLAKPGMWLNNKDRPKESLHHLAVEFLAKAGYDQYFTHGIGHYLGLDVHDVGDYSEPLGEWDVITIEPGLYNPDEKVGIRIEDNYWIVADGAMCLSHELPKDPEEIQAMMAGTLADFEEEDFEEE